MRTVVTLALASLAIPAIAQAQPQAHPPDCRGDVSWVAAAPRIAPDISAFPNRSFAATPRQDVGLDQIVARAEAAMQPQALGAAVLDEDGLWQGRVGEHSAPMFWWASAGKLAVAVAILQLVEEGRLSLDDPASTWIAGAPLGDRITIRMLLNHTSGLFSANEADDVRADPRRRDLSEQLAVATREGSLFCPGQAWRYSNTNYWVLGGILEAAEGAPLDAVLTRRIIARGDLQAIRFMASDDTLRDMEPLGPIQADAGEVVTNPVWVGAAGPLLATPAGAIQFLQAVLTGRLLADPTVQSMLAEPHQMFAEPMYYGLGLMLYEPPAQGAPVIWIGHSGGAPGAKAAMVWSPTDQAYAAVALTGPGSAEAVANALLAARGRRGG